MNPKIVFFALFCAASALFLAGCAQPTQSSQATPTPSPTVVFVSPSASPSFAPSLSPSPLASRAEKIPANATKMTPALDAHPPMLHSAEFEAPIPLPAPVNSAGAEDSPFVTLDGGALYFFFTPDVNVPVEKQLLDGVTGIWVSRKQANGVWGEPARVVLQDAGKLSLDGCQYVTPDGKTIWVCSAREGYVGLHWFKAENAGSPEKWRDWTFAGEWFDENEVGELHFNADASELYFHSKQAGGKQERQGKGQLDLWFSRRNADGVWSEPENVAVVNTPDNEGWPFLNRAGDELWFLRTINGSPAILRSKKLGGVWIEPELIVSQFAGEPSLDDDGNLYFVHHFYEDAKMIEADIYVAKRK